MMIPDINGNFAHNILLLRKKMRMTQQEFGTHIGIEGDPTKRISAIETGKSVGIINLYRVAKILEIPMELLIECKL